MIKSTHHKLSDSLKEAKSCGVRGLLLKLQRKKNDFYNSFKALIYYIECLYLLNSIDPNFLNRSRELIARQNGYTQIRSLSLPFSVETFQGNETEQNLFKFIFHLIRRDDLFKIDIDVEFMQPQQMNDQYKKILQVFN